MAERLDKSKMKCNAPKRTPGHPTKSHVVKACSGGKEKIIRFGEQGAKTAASEKRSMAGKKTGPERKAWPVTPSGKRRKK